MPEGEGGGGAEEDITRMHGMLFGIIKQMQHPCGVTK